MEEARHQADSGMQHQAAPSGLRRVSHDPEVDPLVESRIVASINHAMEADYACRPDVVEGRDMQALCAVLRKSGTGVLPVGSGGVTRAHAAPHAKDTSTDWGLLKLHPTQQVMAAALDADPLIGALGGDVLSPEPAVAPSSSQYLTVIAGGRAVDPAKRPFDIEHILDTGADGRPFEEEGRYMLDSFLSKVMKCDTCGILCDQRCPEALGSGGPSTAGAVLKCRMCMDDDTRTCRMCFRSTASADCCHGALCASCELKNGALPTDEQYGPLKGGGRTPCATIIIGAPGVGKTKVIMAIAAAHDVNGMRHQLIVCAKMAAAAANSHGWTFDRMVAKKFIDKTPEQPAGSSNLKHLNSVRTCVVDEAYTLVLGDLHKLDVTFRQVFGESCGPFGGRHVLYGGDPNQLAPVRNERAALYAYASEYSCFNTSNRASIATAKATAKADGASSSAPAWSKKQQRAFAMWVYWQDIHDVHILHRQYRIKSPVLQRILHDYRTGLRDYPLGASRDARVLEHVAYWNAKCWALNPSLVDHAQAWLTCPAIVNWNRHADLLGPARLLHYAHIAGEQVFGHEATDRCTSSYGAPLRDATRAMARSQGTDKCKSCPLKFLFCNGYRYRLRVSGGSDNATTGKQRPRIRYCNNQLGVARGIEIDRARELDMARKSGRFTDAQCSSWDLYVAASRARDPGGCGVVWLFCVPKCVYFEPDGAIHAPLSAKCVDPAAAYARCFRIAPQTVTFRVELSVKARRKLANIASATGKSAVTGFNVSRTNIRLLSNGGPTLGVAVHCHTREIVHRYRAGCPVCARSLQLCFIQLHV